MQQRTRHRSGHRRSNEEEVMLFRESRERLGLSLAAAGGSVALGLLAHAGDKPLAMPGYGLAALCGILAVANWLKGGSHAYSVSGAMLAKIISDERRRVLAKLASHQQLDPEEVESVHDLYQT